MADIRPTRPAVYPHGALPIGTRLGEFEVRRVLGVGGFGIVYLAFDHLLEREVALKEYMPSTLVDRSETLHVSLISQSHADTFALGLRSFVNEARLLARFDHPSLVKVHRFWEANGTAYMAMALYRGRTAREVRQDMADRPDEAWVRQVLDPLLGAIDRLHSEDVFHRDIAPDNILIEANGRPVLLDFGAARRVITDRSQALTAILKPSYAPIEQYADVDGMKQGAWTDLYALGATVHFLLLGKPPPPAPGRSIQDTMRPLREQELPGFSRAFLELVDWMLSPLPNERPQSVAAVRDALAGRLEVPTRGPTAFERTAPLGGWTTAASRGVTDILIGDDGPELPAADEDATVLVPRGQAGLPRQPLVDDATVVMPGGAGGNGLATPPPLRPQSLLSPSAPAYSAAIDDDDATIVRAAATGFPARTQAFVSAHTALPPAPPAPPPPAAAAAASGTAPRADGGPRGAWLLPVLGGVLVAGAIGGGLWWFLTRPAVPDLAAAPLVVAEAPVPSPAASALPELLPAAAPIVTTTEPAPAAMTVAAPPPPRAAAPVVAANPPAATRPADVRPADARPATKPAADAPRRNESTAATGTAGHGGPNAGAGRSAGTATTAAAAPPAAETSRPQNPAPAAPQNTVAEGPKSPGERCAKELPLVRIICMDLACHRGEYAKHPECVKLRAEQANKRYMEGS